MKSFLLNIGFWNRKRIFWLLHIAGWSILFLLVYGNLHEKIFDFGGFFRLASFYITGFILTAFLRIWLRKMEWSNRTIFRLLGIILGISVLSTLIVYIIHVAVSLPTLGLDIKESSEPLIVIWDIFKQYLFTWHTIFIFMALFLWMILYLGLRFFMDLRVQSERAEKAVIQAQNAQLEMLRYQLNPHFLFNSLNSIWALVDEDPAATKRMINELSDFLRYSLLFDNKAFKPLKHEIEALENYFSIEKKRFQDKLSVVFEIDPKTLGYPVISFLLQPFVENAIKFGMKTSEMPLRIIIKTELKNDDLQITIINSGHWVEPEERNIRESVHSGTGTGLDNARKRLEITYPGRHELRIIREALSVKVKIVIRNAAQNA